MTNLHLLFPEIALSLFAVILMAADMFIQGRNGKALYHLGVLSAALTLGVLGLAYTLPAQYQGLGTLWVVDPLSLFFKVLILATTLLVLMMTADYKAPVAHRHLGTFTALVLLSAVGMMLLVSATDFLLIFLALELVSICSFLLVGYEWRDLKSSEGAMKYFLFGAFSSAVLVYGISLFYGAAGSTALGALPRLLFEGPSPLVALASLLVMVGFGFKVSMAPFHFWVPDAYEGAPTPVTTFLSIAPKISGMALLARIFHHYLPHGALNLTLLFSGLAMLTMTVGNLTAIFQTNIKRLLAYSSVAQAGYLLIGFVTADDLGREGLLLYSMIYVFMNLGAFTVAVVLGNEEGYELDAYDGLSRRNLGLALLMSFFLLSLAGIPPFAGFIGKFYLLSAAVRGGYYWLALVAVLNSVVSVYYYMRVAYHMFFRQPRTLEPAHTGLFLYSGLTLAAVGVLVIGLFPEPFVASVKLSNEFLPALPTPGAYEAGQAALSPLP